MRAKIGDAEFDAEGDADAVSESFRNWLSMVRRMARLPVLKRIAELEAELNAQRELLKRMDEELTPKGQADERRSD